MNNYRKGNEAARKELFIKNYQEKSGFGNNFYKE